MVQNVIVKQNESSEIPQVNTLVRFFCKTNSDKFKCLMKIRSEKPAYIDNSMCVEKCNANDIIET